jgi:amino acid transporter
MTHLSSTPTSDVGSVATAADEKLPRKLGVFGLIFLLVAFNAPIAAMAGFQQLAIGFGNGAGAPPAFLIAGGVLLLFSVGFVGMSKHTPNPGQYYRYVVDGLGRPAGLAGAFLATVAYIALLPGSVIYLGLVLVDTTTRLFGTPVLNWQAWALISLVVVTILALLRVDLSMKVLGVLVALECVVVAVWELAILIRGGPEGYSAASFSGSTMLSGSIGLAIMFAMLTMIGIESPACFRDEARDPGRSVGRATYIGIGFLTVFYALGSWVYIISQGSSKVVDEALNNPVGSFMGSIESYIGSVFVQITTIVLVTSQLAATNAGLGLASRYLHALGRDRALPRRLARVHPRLQSPHVAVLTVVGIGLLAVVLSIFSGIDAVSAYAAMTGAGIYLLLPLLAMTSLSVIVYFRRNRQLASNRWVAVVAPGLSAVAIVVLFVLVTPNLSILTGSSVGAVIAIVGVVVIPVAGVAVALFYRRTRPETYARIGNSIHADA